MKKLKLNLARVDLFTGDPDQPTQCPECGSRTEFEDVDISGCSSSESVNADGFQRHLCLNARCELHTTPFFIEFEERPEETTYTDHFEVFDNRSQAEAKYADIQGCSGVYTSSIAQVIKSTDHDASFYIVCWCSTDI